MDSKTLTNVLIGIVLMVVSACCAYLVTTNNEAHGILHRRISNVEKSINDNENKIIALENRR